MSDRKPTAHESFRLPLTRRISGFLRLLPDYIIIGAQKAGTTTIYDNLIQHPDVAPCSIKEVHFFDLHWDKGENWYRAHFPLKQAKNKALRQHRRLVTGEGSPYYLFHPLAPQRVAELIPHARLIAVLRDPVKRAYSHYQHEQRKGREPLSFEDALKAEPERLEGEWERVVNDPKYNSFNLQHYSYMARGHYAEQSQRWHKALPKENLLIVSTEEMNSGFSEVMGDVQQFLGLRQVSINRPVRKNVGTYEPMSEAARSLLTEHFKQPNDELAKLLNRRFSWNEPVEI